jgi:inositol-phosphate phosphatase/L-galactose 1-phosphate phosphatase/histidinol-phosphatase
MCNVELGRSLYNNQCCASIRYTTSPHLFEGDAEDAFIRVREKVCTIFCDYIWLLNLHHQCPNSHVCCFTCLWCKVKVPLYGCDCYAYALLASGFVDLVVESGLKVYSPIIDVHIVICEMTFFCWCLKWTKLKHVDPFFLLKLASYI